MNCWKFVPLKRLFSGSSNFSNVGQTIINRPRIISILVGGMGSPFPGKWVVRHGFTQSTWFLGSKNGPKTSCGVSSLNQIQTRSRAKWNHRAGLSVSGCQLFEAGSHRWIRMEKKLGDTNHEDEMKDEMKDTILR